MAPMEWRRICCPVDFSEPARAGLLVAAEPSERRSYRGEPCFVPEPPEADCSCPYDEVFYPAAQPRPCPGD